MCLPTVVAEFSRLVARLGLMDCAQLLPQRSQAMRAQRPLEMFFPFDPYLLRRSAQVCTHGKSYHVAVQHLSLLYYSGRRPSRLRLPYCCPAHCHSSAFPRSIRQCFVKFLSGHKAF